MERGGKRKMRVTEKDLRIQEKRVNDLLKNIQVKVAFRYNYTAIDLVKNGVMTDTLITALSKRMALDILEAIERLLRYEKT
jgi:hypothetical protein